MYKTLFLPLLLCLLIACSAEPTSEEKTQQAQVEEHVDQPAPAPEAPPAPKPVPDYDTSQWVDILDLDSSLILDIRYATANNFVKEQLYDCGRCFLRPEVAQAVLAAQQQLQAKGLGIKLFDCYRPRPIQQKLWDKVPNASYVTPPSKGSMHNRGSAVDLTIVRPDGQALAMGTAYDYFGKEAHHTYTQLPDSVLENRKLLLETMASVGLKHIRTEWWHYSYPAASYELSDMLWKCD